MPFLTSKTDCSHRKCSLLSPNPPPLPASSNCVHAIRSAYCNLLCVSLCYFLWSFGPMVILINYNKIKRTTLSIWLAKRFRCRTRHILGRYILLVFFKHLWCALATLFVKCEPSDPFVKCENVTHFIIYKPSGPFFNCESLTNRTI